MAVGLDAMGSKGQGKSPEKDYLKIKRLKGDMTK